MKLFGAPLLLERTDHFAISTIPWFDLVQPTSKFGPSKKMGCVWFFRAKNGEIVVSISFCRAGSYCLWTRKTLSRYRGSFGIRILSQGIRLAIKLSLILKWLLLLNWWAKRIVKVFLPYSMQWTKPNVLDLLWHHGNLWLKFFWFLKKEKENKEEEEHDWN